MREARSLKVGKLENGDRAVLVRWLFEKGWDYKTVVILLR